MLYEVITHRGTAAAAFAGIAKQATPARIRRIDPDLEVSFLNVAVEIEVADAGFDQRVVVLLINLQSYNFV